MTDAAGASGTSTGNSVVSLTNSATCGFQNITVAYQLTSTVLDGSSGVANCPPTRSRNFRVPCTTSTVRVC